MHEGYVDSDRFYDEVEPASGDGQTRYTYYLVDPKAKFKYVYEELETLDEYNDDSDYYYYTTVYDDDMNGKHFELWQTYSFEGRTVREKLVKRIERLNAVDEYLSKTIKGYADCFIKRNKEKK